MFYKISVGTPLFDRLLKFREKMSKCNDAAFKLVKELGYTEFRLNGHIAGGISMIKIEGKAPKNWERVSKKIRAYMPKRIIENKELWDKINKLPLVEPNDLNKILKYEGDYVNNETNQISLFPAAMWNTKYVLVKIPEWVHGYKPVKGMTEITVTEYTKLKEAIEKKRKKK